MAKNRNILWLVLAVVAYEAVVSLGEGSSMVDTICGFTIYKDVCLNSLGPEAGNLADPKDILRMSFKAAKDQISKGLEESKTIQDAKKDKDSAEALEICRQVMEYAVNDLERTINSTTEFKLDNMDLFIEDLKIWIGGSITYQDACFDAFENTSTEAGKKIREFFSVSRELSSNALTMVSDIKDFLKDYGSYLGDLASLLGGRTLLGKKAGGWVAGEAPAWADNPKRKVMNVPLNQIKPDLVVAQDGSGQHKTLGEALKHAPKKSMEPFIIHIKAGTYKEVNLIPKDTWNVILVGDGPDKTILTGDRSFKRGFTTFNTATLGVDGDGFMARDIKFENTAGPEGHQAVALRVASDFAVFHNCKFDGAQDTLYSMKGRQFYRDCTITGTVDFIFGNAQAVYQNCQIMIAKPSLHQDIEVTAQGRTEPNGPGVFVIQGCRIVATDGYKTFKNSPGRSAYLGRPWKEYSRTIIMNSFIDGAISPEGWHPWPGSNANQTAYYAEYENQGPGADTSKRVTWPAIKKLSPQDAESFTPAKLFVDPNVWISNTGVPFEAGKFSV